MRLTRLFALSFFALLLTLPVAAQKPALPTHADALSIQAHVDKLSIQAVLTKQASDWNRGDLNAFAAGYKNSPDILFIGSTVRRGYDGMIESYRKNYPNKSAMGELSFTNVEVHPLDAHFATVIGNFHLERTTAGGGNADGFYSLVLEKTSAGWKIILDHTTAAAH